MRIKESFIVALMIFITVKAGSGQVRDNFNAFTLGEIRHILSNRASAEDCTNCLIKFVKGQCDYRLEGMDLELPKMMLDGFNCTYSIMCTDDHREKLKYVATTMMNSYPDLWRKLIVGAVADRPRVPLFWTPSAQEGRPSRRPSGAPQDPAYCDAWCVDPPGSGQYKCCDKIAPAAECPEDRRNIGSCDPQGDRNPPNRCYKNGDCSSGLLCCFDACLGQTCKNPSSGGAAPAPAVTQAPVIPADDQRSG